MKRNLRRTVFVTYVIIFRPFLWALIWLIGRTGLIKTIFLIYPTDPEEYVNLCPDSKWFLNFLSGRPTPAGIIFDQGRPTGIYCFISNSPGELMKKKNRALAESIVRRMQWIQKISGARTCGFAGQLGPILEKRHNIPMKAPFFSSTMGNIFSIDNALNYLARKEDRHPWQLSVAILGGGELSELLLNHLAEQGYTVNSIELRFQRRGGIQLKDLDNAGRILDQADFVINLLPTGKDFLHCGAGEFLHKTTTVIDFSRPMIPREKIQASVYMGNRVQRKGSRFAFALPGWKQRELPACSIPSILAANYGVVEQKPGRFCTAARRLKFETALAAPARPTGNTLVAALQLAGRELTINCRFYLHVARQRLSLVSGK